MPITECHNSTTAQHASRKPSFWKQHSHILYIQSVRLFYTVSKSRLANWVHLADDIYGISPKGPKLQVLYCDIQTATRVMRALNIAAVLFTVSSTISGNPCSDTWWLGPTCISWYNRHSAAKRTQEHACMRACIQYSYHCMHEVIWEAVETTSGVGPMNIDGILRTIWRRCLRSLPKNFLPSSGYGLAAVGKHPCREEPGMIMKSW